MDRAFCPVHASLLSFVFVKFMEDFFMEKNGNVKPLQILVKLLESLL